MRPEIENNTAILGPEISEILRLQICQLPTVTVKSETWRLLFPKNLLLLCYSSLTYLILFLFLLLYPFNNPERIWLEMV